MKSQIINSNALNKKKKTKELISLIDSHGETCLHSAVWHHNLDGVMILLHCGANVTQLNNNSMSPLDIAPSLTNILLEHIVTPPPWVNDDAVPCCQLCNQNFTFINRRVFFFFFFFFFFFAA